MAVSNSGQTPDLTDRIREVNSRLKSEFGERIPPETIDQMASDSFESMKDATIADFVPLFVERSMRERLREKLSNNGASA